MTCHVGTACLCFTVLSAGHRAVLAESGQERPTAAAYPIEPLPFGFVRGDVVSYSYVPIRQWGRAEAIGKLPYLFEYALLYMEDGPDPLEKWHDENIRRIDLASQWSTAITLSHRYEHYRDEIINLMIRCFRNRQLMILSAEEPPDDPHRIIIGLLERLWRDRDRALVSPEGDRATGLQLINNILMIHNGDEELGMIKTEGLKRRNQIFAERIRNRIIDGRRPFAHIRSWFNEIHYPLGSFAADEADLARGRHRWPANCEFIGVDTYHFWSYEHSPDPDDPNVPRSQVSDHAVAWQNVVTRYYGEGLRVGAGEGWEPRYCNDTHAMLQGIDLGGADQAMLVFIGNSCCVRGHSYTTPIETMGAYYDALKAGPWVGLSWWVFGGYKEFSATLDYVDKKLLRYTPDHPEGVPYTDAELERHRQRFIESRMRMFNDVVHNQFGNLNGPAPRK